MTTVRFEHHLNSKRHCESLLETMSKEWSGFVYSFKIKQSQRITVLWQSRTVRE